eukprot:734885-Prymnesium_polylepis.1
MAYMGPTSETPTSEVRVHISHMHTTTVGVEIKRGTESEREKHYCSNRTEKRAQPVSFLPCPEHVRCGALPAAGLRRPPGRFGCTAAVRALVYSY